MGPIFISHVEEDRELVLRLAEGLEAAGLQTWYYERDSLPGHSYFVQTGQAVQDAAAVVVLISPRSIKSAQVTKEIVRGAEAEKPFIPLLLDLTHVEFQQRQPEWREALGSAASLAIPPEGIAKVLPRVVASLVAMGIKGTAAGPLPTPVAPPSREAREPEVLLPPTRSRVSPVELGILSLALLASLGYALVGFLGSRANGAAQAPLSAAAPKWVNKGSGPFTVEGRRVWRGVGIAQLIENRPLAIATANLRACDELGALRDQYFYSLRGAVSNPHPGSAGASEGPGVASSTLKSFAKIKLEGPNIVRRWRDPADGTDFSLCEIGNDALTSQLAASVLESKVRDYIRANAEKAFDELTKGDEH